MAFRVYESEGRLKAQVLHVEYIEEKLQPSPALALEGEVAESGAAPESASVAQPIVSPFVDSSFIYTIGSKPRAPAHR